MSTEDAISREIAAYDYAHLQCSQCRHWHALPPSPHNLGVRAGMCRYGPPSIIPTNQGIMPVYPGMASDFPACSRIELRVVADNGRTQT